MSGQSISLNLGEVLRGDRIMASDIELKVGIDKSCQVLCNQNISRQDLDRARYLIADEYVVEWIVDNLPGATRFITTDKKGKYYAAGFKLGYTEISPMNGKMHYYLYNHHVIIIRYRKAPGRRGRRGKKVILGFEVFPKSIGRDNRMTQKDCPVDLRNIDRGFELYMAPNKTIDYSLEYPNSSYWPDTTLLEAEQGTMSIPYTYSVHFLEDESIEWSHRWELFYANQIEGSRIHWLAIVNSLIICGLLTVIVMLILARTVHTDIKSYMDAAAEGGKDRVKRKVNPGVTTPKDQTPGPLNQNSDPLVDLTGEEDSLDDLTGWKLLHADVFRTPRFGTLLAPLVGSGMQLLVMALGLVLLSAMGWLNPSFRGGFISVGVGLFVFAGLFSGYFSARTFKSFDGKDFRRNALITALLFPGLSFGIAFVLNIFVWGQASSTAIPFSTLLLILVLWLCIQLPLVYAGSYYGYLKASIWEHPTKTAIIPRQIPQQLWYLKFLQSILLAGLVPFAVIFIELFYVFQSLWQDKSGYYYVFGFLAVVSVILLVTIAEVTIVAVYIQLCSENHNWWWQSFFVGGGSALWIFAYCIYYYMFKLHISGFVSSTLFFSYSFMACCVYGLLAGTVGFLSAYAFVRRIYA